MNFESEVVPNKLRSADDWIVIEERGREKMEIEREWLSIFCSPAREQKVHALLPWHKYCFRRRSKTFSHSPETRLPRVRWPKVSSFQKKELRVPRYHFPSEGGKKRGEAPEISSFLSGFGQLDLYARREPRLSTLSLLLLFQPVFQGLMAIGHAYAYSGLISGIKQSLAGS